LLALHLLLHLQQTLWATAAKHHLGKGLEGGVGWTQARAQIRTWTNRGDHGRADMAKLVAQGGIWTRSRLRDDGHPVEGVCPRCLNAEETALHFFWERPSNATCPHIDVQSTQYLILLAAASAVDDPGLWLRGLVARTKTFGIVAAPDDELALHNWGCFAGPLPFALPGPAVGAADGSGASDVLALLAISFRAQAVSWEPSARRCLALFRPCPAQGFSVGSC